MSNYKRILVAIDFSDISESTAKRAVELATFYKAELIFLHVIEHFPDHLPHYKISREDMDLEEFLVDRARKDLQGLCSRLEKEGVEQRVCLTKHSATREILKFAQDNEINLIVLGAKGHHRLTELVAGSTATGVVRTAQCDVFTIRGE